MKIRKISREIINKKNFIIEFEGSVKGVGAFG